MAEVCLALPARRLVHVPTGDVGTLVGLDVDGHQMVVFDGDTWPTSLLDYVLADAGPADEVAAALKRSELLLTYADGVDDWLDRQEVRRVNEAAGNRLAECRWCGADVWERPCPEDRGGYVSCVLCDGVYEWLPGDFGDCPDCGRRDVTCRACRYKDGG
jgi:hypothetical protein